MNNWSPEHTKVIKSWFKIDTYRKFEDLSLIQFYHEIWARKLFFKEYREEFESRALAGYFSKIFSGNPFLIEEGQLGYMTPANKLFQPPHFFLTTLDRLAETSIIAMQRGGFLWHEGDNYSINAELREESLSDIMPDQFTRTIMFEIWQVAQTKRLQSRLKLHYRSGVKLRVLMKTHWNLFVLDTELSRNSSVIV